MNNNLILRLMNWGVSKFDIGSGESEFICKRGSEQGIKVISVNPQLVDKKMQ
jgi:hypothetical protein